MARMLDQIRSSQVPSNLMQFAARGALAVPPEETIEILVYLALHNKIIWRAGADYAGGLGRESEQGCGS